jgi:predicted enzyme related to lactoylglutathione lyase
MGANAEMFLGLRTAQYHIKPSEVKPARHWYAKVLGLEPYFDEPFYVGFSVGGFELGLVPDEAHAGKQGSVFVYWGVTEIAPALERLLASGATILGDVEDIGHGIRKVSVLDPFGNCLSIIENPHFGK